MKKFLNFLKIKKDDSQQDEEFKHSPRQEEVDQQQDDNSTKEKDSNSNSDENSREAKLEEIKKSMLDKKIKKFDALFSQKIIDLEKLKAISWSGIPSSKPSFRCETWRLLLDYQPNDQEMVKETLSRKREEYTDMIEHYFGSIGFDSVQELLSKKEMSTYEKKSMKQIKIDVYRTQPEAKIFSIAQVQIMMIRILFSWTMRHPASGYVQGINDLAAPLILVFLTEYLSHPDQDNIFEIQEKELEEMDIEDLIKVEADTFWCLSKLVDDIQDNYTELQPGVHKIINKMKKLIEQKDEQALDHLDQLDINFMDFAYRWVSCYLTREFNIVQIIRLWDTYFSEDEGFSQFHCYVCAALFLQFSKDFKNMQFQDAMLFLQNLPTASWTDDDINILMAKSYEMKQLYHYNTHLYQS